MRNRNEAVNKQSVQFDVREEPRELQLEQLEIHANRRRNNRRNSDTDYSEPLEIGQNLNQNRTRRSTVCNRSSRRSWVNPFNQELDSNSDLSDYNDIKSTILFA